MDLTTLAVAAAGLAGTLTSPLLTQWIASLAKRQEFEFQGRSEREEREAARIQAMLDLKRSLYVSLNAAARHYQQELDDYIRLLNDGHPGNTVLADLDEARRKFRDLYAEAQMILPDPVLEAAVEVSAILGDAYGIVRRLQSDKPRTNPETGTESLAQARQKSHVAAYNCILSMRRLMREDLGVS